MMTWMSRNANTWFVVCVCMWVCVTVRRVPTGSCLCVAFKEEVGAGVFPPHCSWISFWATKLKLIFEPWSFRSMCRLHTLHQDRTYKLSSTLHLLRVHESTRVQIYHLHYQLVESTNTSGDFRPIKMLLLFDCCGLCTCCQGYSWYLKCLCYNNIISDMWNVHFSVFVIWCMSIELAGNWI